MGFLFCRLTPLQSSSGLGEHFQRSHSGDQDPHGPTESSSTSTQRRGPGGQHITHAAGKGTLLGMPAFIREPGVRETLVKLFYHTLPYKLVKLKL